MRLSNFFIYGSLTIIIAASVGFLIFKSFDAANGGEGKDSRELAAQVKKLTAENENLLNESGEAVKKYTQQIASLNDDLQRASQLLMEKDQELDRLKNNASANPESNPIVQQLAGLLNCQPTQLAANVGQLVTEYNSLKRKFDIVNQQLSRNAQRGETNGGGQANKSNEADVNAEDRKTPLIKQLELAAPQNQWALGGQGNADAKLVEDKSPENQKAETVEPKQAEPKDNAVVAKEDNTQVDGLFAKIESLESELRNREKLLFEQTSLIEDLKKKSRVETGLRTGTVESGTIQINSPFKDRGTFKVQDR